MRTQKAHLGKKAKPICLGLPTFTMPRKITSPLRQADSITVDPKSERKFEKICNRRRMETRNKRYQNAIEWMGETQTRRLYGASSTPGPPSELSLHSLPVPLEPTQHRQLLQEKVGEPK